MATPGRGRGYSGRHHLRDPRPGDKDTSEELDAVRTLAELSPRATDVLKEVPIEPKLLESTALDLEDPAVDQTCDDEAALTELLQVDDQYRPLISLLEQFTTGEDGIQFNRKLRQFETTVTNMCPDESRLIQVFGTFRGAALHSSALTRKLSAVGASFTRQQKQRALRCALLDVMQTTHAKLDVLERSNPIYLINAANLMGDYFAEARLCNGNKVHLLASPLLQYMRSLLASDDIRAHRSLATQLMQNGRELLSVLPQELDELSISIRLRLLTPPPVSTIWLILSADLCLNKFLPLPNTLQQFYASHLELSNEDNYSEVSYGSWKKTPEKEREYALDSSQEGSDKVSHNLSQISINENGEVKPKLRPILGAGAGLLRQEHTLPVGQDNYETWTPKSLNKRYDLNSWRQNAEPEQSDDSPVFNPSVLPPNMQNFTVPLPDYPPPTVTRFNYQETYPNYLQQGDGTFIQNQYVPNTNFTPQGDFVPQYQNEIPTPEKVNNETQQSCNRQSSYSPTNFQTQIPHDYEDKTNNDHKTKKPVENWRKEKTDIKEDPNQNKTKNWTRQRSKDNLHEDDEKYKNTRLSRDSLPGSRVNNRLNRRTSSEKEIPGALAIPGTPGAPGIAKTPPRRHVSDVPRNNRYWDHDDRCDKDYNS